MQKDWIEFKINRLATGTFIWVRAVPAVEDFFAAITGAGRISTIEGIGGSWETPKGALLPVKAYLPEADISTTGYVLQDVGGALQFRDGSPNLSFLQLVGISTPEGVTFKLTHPLSMDAYDQLKGKLQKACLKFLADHLMPTSSSFKIYSQE